MAAKLVSGPCSMLMLRFDTSAGLYLSAASNSGLMFCIRCGVAMETSTVQEGGRRELHPGDFSALKVLCLNALGFGISTRSSEKRLHDLLGTEMTASILLLVEVSFELEIGKALSDFQGRQSKTRFHLCGAVH